jgi:hypothetical protein
MFGSEQTVNIKQLAWRKNTITPRLITSNIRCFSFFLSLQPMKWTSCKFPAATKFYYQVHLSVPLVFDQFPLKILAHFFLSRYSMTSQLKYENVPFDDHEGSSTTDVEESLLGDEKLMHEEEFRRRHATKSKRAACLSILSQVRWVLDTVLLLVIVWLLVRDQSQKAMPMTSENEVGGDFTGVGPHCRQLPRDARNDSSNLTLE